MTTDVALVVAVLATRVREAAHAGAPISKAAAVAMLRAAGMSRDRARATLAAEAAGRWVLMRGEATRRGGRPTQILLPSNALVSEVVAAAKTIRRGRPEPVDTRAPLLAAARAAGFPRLEIRLQVVILAGERWWQRFAALALPTDVARAFRALGVQLDAGDR